MDSVICLADALNYLTAAGEQQPDFLQEIRSRIHFLNPHCEIIEATFADISGQEILDRFAYRTDHVQSHTLDIFKTEKYIAGHKHALHSISSNCFSLQGAFDIEKFSYWIAYFLYINQSTVFRIKGILNFEGIPHKRILQSIRSSYLMEDGDY